MRSQGHARLLGDALVRVLGPHQAQAHVRQAQEVGVQRGKHLRGRRHFLHSALPHGAAARSRKPYQANPRHITGSQGNPWDTLSVHLLTADARATVYVRALELLALTRRVRQFE